MLTVWVIFAVCTLVILVSGSQVSKYADVISVKTGLGGVWIGIVLLATVTSLPEAIAGISGIVVFDVPEIAVGAVLGSCMFNLLIIAALDPTSRTVPILSRVSQGHILAASFGVILLGTAAAGILAAETIPVVGWVSLTSLALLGIYLFGMRIIYSYERHQLPDAGEADRLSRYSDISTRRAYLMFAGNAVFIVGAAVILPGVGEDIANQTGLGQGLVGSSFIALSTSLPEVVVALTAIRIGAVNLAIAGLFGSNLFNLAILALDDMLFLDGSIYQAVDETHAFTATTAVVMTGIAILGLMLRPRTKPPYLDWDALTMIVVYVGAVIILFSLS